MVKFESEILNNILSVKIKINDKEYFNNVYLNLIEFGYYNDNATKIILKTFNVSGKRSVSFELDINSGAFIDYTIDGEVQTVPTSVVNPEDVIFYYSVTTQGTPSSDTPCIYKTTNPFTSFTVPMESLYKKTLNKLSLYNCNYPTNTVNDILLFNYLEYALKTNNEDVAVDLWNSLVKNLSSSSSYSKYCGCNG